MAGEIRQGTGLGPLMRIVKASGAGTAAPYAFATLLSAVASVAAVIILTRLLSAQGYGAYAAAIGLGMIIQNAGYLALQTGILRFHARAGSAEGEQRLATSVRIAFCAATAVVALLWAGAVQWLGGAGVSGPLAWWGLALLVLRGWLSLVQAWNRAQGRPWTYFALETMQAFGALLLGLVALSFAPERPEALLAGAALACGLAAACAPALLLAPIRRRGTGALLRELAIYGAPLALVFLAGALLAVSDRLLVAIHLGAAAAGAYAVAFAIADRFMNLLLLPFPVANKPALFAAWEQGGEAGARPVLERSAKWLIALGFPAATVLIVAPGPIADVLIGGGMAEESARLIPLLAVGSLLSCFLSLHFALAFQLTRKTHWMLLALGPAALLNVAANVVLIPRFGAVAAGWTTVAGYALALALALLLGRRQVTIPFPPRTALLTLLACLPLAAALYFAAP